VGHPDIPGRAAVGCGQRSRVEAPHRDLAHARRSGRVKIATMATRGRAWLALVVIIGALAACSGSANPPLQALFEKVVQDVLPGSIVQINTNNSIGAGVVYDDHGDVVTNDHVVEGAETIEVLRTTNARPLAAKIIGTSTANDLAVIRVQAGADTLTPARFGNSDDVKIGQFVLAMGDPLGLTDSVTQGIISAAHRKVTETDSGAALTVIQTSAPINPGNSGGGLVDVNGNVVGMPTLGVSNPEGGGAAPGIGFAIPSNTIKRVASQLIARAG
jgi:putative serine protease PepD